MKKILTIILAVLISATSLPVYALADEKAEITKNQLAEQETAEVTDFAEEPVAYAAASSGGTWIKESNGRWWYKHADGSYTKYDWEYINGSWYFFDKNGWMWTDWLEWKSDWYYLDLISGKMHTGWSHINGEWYYFKSNGIMNTMPIELGNRFYTFYTWGSQKGWLRSTTIYIDEEKQHMSNWCWAACSVMVGRYGTDSQIIQSQVVNEIKGTVINLGGTEKDEVKGIYIASEERKNAVIIGNDKFEFNDIVDIIDANHPLILNLYWNDGSKHAVVCAGYDRHTGQIYIVNPAESMDSMLYDYKRFMSDITMGLSRGHCVNMVKY